LGEEWGDVLWALGVGLGEAHDYVSGKSPIFLIRRKEELVDFF
jgi:hypothetical protein